MNTPTSGPEGSELLFGGFKSAKKRNEFIVSMIDAAYGKREFVRIMEEVKHVNKILEVHTTSLQNSSENFYATFNEKYLKMYAFIDCTKTQMQSNLSMVSTYSKFATVKEFLINNPNAEQMNGTNTLNDIVKILQHELKKFERTMHKEKEAMSKILEQGRDN